MTPCVFRNTEDGSTLTFEFVPHTSRVVVHKNGRFAGTGWRRMSESVQEFADRWVNDRKNDYVPLAQRTPLANVCKPAQ